MAKGRAVIFEDLPRSARKVEVTLADGAVTSAKFP
jgi:hypothetical protein